MVILSPEAKNDVDKMELLYNFVPQKGTMNILTTSVMSVLTASAAIFLSCSKILLFNSSWALSNCIELEALVHNCWCSYIAFGPYYLAFW